MNKYIVIITTLSSLIVVLIMVIFLGWHRLANKQVGVIDMNCTNLGYSYFYQTNPFIESINDLQEKKDSQLRQQNIYMKLLELCKIDVRNEQEYQQHM